MGKIVNINAFLPKFNSLFRKKYLLLGKSKVFWLKLYLKLKNSGQWRSISSYFAQRTNVVYITLMKVEKCIILIDNKERE